MPSTNSRALGSPRGAALSDTDRELLDAIAETLAGLREDADEKWHDIARRLEAAGWEVGWRIGWIAEARRRGVHEQVVGRSRADAFAQLASLALLDDVEGCP